MDDGDHEPHHANPSSVDAVKLIGKRK